jgi:dihydrodipicolinate synthase/N-acetylneuraminate lyase
MLAYSASDLRGVIAAPPTPYVVDPAHRSAGTVDLDESARMVGRLIDDGVQGLMTNGTLGEMPTLTEREWQAFTETVQEVVADRAPDMPVFYGATTLGFEATADRIRHVQRIGGRGIFLGRPFWCAMGPEAMVKWYEDISDAFPDIAIVLYDNGEAFKGPIPTPVYAQVSKRPQFVGAKYIAVTPKFGGDMEAVGDRMRLFALDAEWFQARMLYPEEAVVCWSSSVCCGPEPVLRLRDLLDGGDVDAARALTRRMDWAYEPFLARQNFPEFSRYNITLEKLRFDEAGYIHAGPARRPYDFVPDAYAEGARESGRRWRTIVDEVAAVSV